MIHIMRKLILSAFAACIAGLLCFPAMAQQEDTMEPAGGSVQPESVKGQNATHQKALDAKRNAIKKKKAAPPVSEYKFQTTDMQQVYIFDKKGDPIVKKKNMAVKGSGKSKKTAATAAKRAAGQPIPKLKGSSANNAARYVCPMGDYEGDKPGKCPKCGMTLEKQ